MDYEIEEYYQDPSRKLDDELRERALKERQEKDKLDALRRKEKHEHSAIASSEVKQRLQEFVLNKKQREAKQQQQQQQQQQQLHSHHHHHHHPHQHHQQHAIGGGSGGPINNGQPPGNAINKGSNNNSSQLVNLAWNPLLGKYEEDLITLRKTASEPNLKVRSALKQKVIERRSSPLLKRKLAKTRLRHPPSSSGSSTLVHQHSLYGSITEGSASAPVSASSSMESSTPPNSKTESIPGSPPALNGPQTNVIQSIGMGSSAASTPLREERNVGGSGSPFSLLTQSNDLQLYSSPSLPNISLGRPHVSSAPGSQAINMNTGDNGRIFPEAQCRGSVNRLVSSGAPGSSQFPSILTFCPSLPVIQGEFSPPTSPTYGQQMKPLEAESSIPPDECHITSYQGNHIHHVTQNDGQVGHIRLAGGKTIHRPLGRTQSAPLPLGHPMLQSCSSPSSLNCSQEHQHHRSSLVKQHVRQTVLTRASSKQKLQSQSFEEETEAAIAQDMKDSVPIIPSRKERIKRQYSQEAPPTPEEQLPCGIDSYSIDYRSSSGCKSREPTPDAGTRGEVIKQQSREREAFLAQQRDLMSPRLAMPMNDPALYQQLIYQLQQQLILIQGQQQHQHQQQPPQLQPQPQPQHQHQPQPSPQSQNSSHPQTVSLLPEGNQYPQILPHSRYPYYHSSRPLSRASSSPLVALISSGSLGSQEKSSSLSPPMNNWKSTTGLAYDNLMLKHQCICGDNSHHPEHSGRLQSIWARLQETGLASRCEKIRSRKATLEEIQSCHSEAYTLLFGASPLNRQKLDPSKLAELPIKSFVMLPCGGIGVDSDTTWNELHTASAARMAAGCVTELALKVATGDLKNGFAIVRPPGHHAEQNQAMGFCFFNSLAIAAQQLRKRLDMETVLIIDWDVHHGNGIQQIFYDSSHVLYISLHRHDDGNFFPGTGDPQEIGVEDGTGFNVNIAWSGGITPETKGDAEYLAAFRSIVLPIARDFDPEVILIACGFDAAAGHPPPLGGYQVSPACYAWMTKQLMKLANGKLVLSLEGGYDLPSICDCAQECVTALLGDEITQISEPELNRKPTQQAIDTLKRVISIQAAHWPVVKRYAHLIDCSHLEAQDQDEEFGAVSALASLSMKHLNSQPSNEEPMDQDMDK